MVSGSFLQTLKSLWAAYPWFFVALGSIAVVAGFFGVAVEYKIKEIIDAIATDGIDQLGFLIFLFAAYKTLYHGLFFLRRLLSIRYMPRILESTVSAFYQQTVQHSLHWFDSQLSGEISNKIFDFQDGVIVLIRSSFSILNTLVSILIALVFLVFVNVQTAFVLLVFILVYVPVIAFLLRYQQQLYKKTSSARQNVVGVINDSIANIFGVKVIGSLESEFDSQIKPSIRSWREADRKAKQSDAFLVDSVDTLLVVGMSATQMYLLAVLLQKGQISAGDFAFIAIVTLNIHSQLEKFLDQLLFHVNPAVAQIRAAFEKICTPVDVFDAPNAQQLTDVRGAIEYQNVTFHYGEPDLPGLKKQAPQQLVLRDISLQIKPGERLGIVGTSGAGKTTLVKCLLRYFDLAKGHLYIDGQDIQSVTQASLRANVSIIPQDIVLFHRSILENIRLAKPDATYADIELACKKARIHEDILQMPQQYATLVGERGVKLSGGQRQRVAIARAILKDASILILDEATSSLDTATEHLIQQSLNDILASSKSTVIAIAHRLSTLKHMDRIVVMDQGRIVEVGTHDDLLRQSGLYKRLWDLQLF